MGGWILSSSHYEQQANLISKFKRVFDVPAMPPLHVDVTHNNDFFILLWSWSKPPVPDVAVIRDAQNTNFLILHGVINGLGKFGSVNGTLKELGTKILDLWIQKADEVIEELNGSFSCIFFNKKKKTITLYTDRFASRPVWFVRDYKSWHLGNSSAALASIRISLQRLDGGGIWSLFACSRHVGTRGLYYGIKNISSSSKVVLNPDGSYEISRWWKRRYHPQFGISLDEWGKRIAHSLLESGRRLKQHISDPCIFLSGGLDSRIVACALGEGTNTVTLSTGYNMNTRIAERVAKDLRSEHETIFRTPYWYLDMYPAAALIGGGNYNIQHAHFLVPIQRIKMLKPKSTFLLGDCLENFNKHYFHLVSGEYPDYRPEKIPEIFHKIYSYTHHNIDRLRALFRPEFGERMYNSWKQEIINSARSNTTVSDDPRDLFDSLFRWNNCSCCPTYMMFECIWPLASEANLMFSNELNELLLQVPADIKGLGVLHKYILKNLKKSLVFIPDSNSWLPPFLPNRLQKLSIKIRPFIGKTRRMMISIFRNNKGPIVNTEGSWHMLHEWYRKDKFYKSFIENCLYDRDALPPDIFDKNKIEIRWKEFLEGDISYKFEIDMLISFGLLHKVIPASGIEFS